LAAARSSVKNAGNISPTNCANFWMYKAPLQFSVINYSHLQGVRTMRELQGVVVSLVYSFIWQRKFWPVKKRDKNRLTTIEIKFFRRTSGDYNFLPQRNE
jgi:hypothetical protein